MKLGLKAPVPGALKLRLASYINWAQMPPVPDQFGHQDMVTNWGTPPDLGNLNYGDCAWAGAAHQTIVFCAEGSKPCDFTTPSVLGNYAACTGFNQNDPKTDQGTAISDLTTYWQNTGLVDANGVHHTVVAALDLNPGDLREIWLATYLFTVGLGYSLPQSAQDQFTAGKVWTPVPHSPILGGHYVPLLGRYGGLGYGFTWGKPQLIAAEFIQQYNDQGVACLSEEMLTNTKSLDGFDDATLRDDIKQLSSDSGV